MRRPSFEVRAADRLRIETEDEGRKCAREDAVAPSGELRILVHDDPRESDVSTKQCGTVREDTAPSVKTTSDRNGYPPLPHRLRPPSPRPSDALP